MKFFFKKIWWFNLLKQIHFNLHLNRWKTVARLGFCCWWVVRFYLAFQLWKSNRIAERTESNRWVLELLRSCAWSTILMCLRLSTSTGHRGMLVCDNGQWSTTSPRAFSYQIMVHNVGLYWVDGGPQSVCMSTLESDDCAVTACALCLTGPDRRLRWW